MAGLLIGFMRYLEACFLDIKSLFGQMDRLTERKIYTAPTRMNWDLLMLRCCKEAVDLHQEVNRYCLHSTNHLHYN